jgi:hypothetical protein
VFLCQPFKLFLFMLFSFLVLYLQHIWVLFHDIAYFIHVFIRVFSFIHISDRFARYSRDYHHSFVFARFLCYYCFLSHINLFELHCWVSSFWHDFSSVRTKKRWDEGKNLSLSEAQATWGYFYTTPSRGWT